MFDLSLISQYSLVPFGFNFAFPYIKFPYFTATFPSYIYIFASQHVFLLDIIYSIHSNVITQCNSPYWPKPRGYVHVFNPLHVCWSPIVPLGPFDGRVAAVIEGFVCTTPNQSYIPFHLCIKQKFNSVLMFAMVWMTQHFYHSPGLRYFVIWVLFPESPMMPTTLFPSCGGTQPATTSNHLAAALLMDWASCRVQGYCYYRQWCLTWRIESNSTSRLPLLPTNFSYCWWEQCRDAFVCLHFTFTEMRIGITEFQQYYLEICGCLDYLELYKPCMDGSKPAAETIANCVGAITNILCIVQDFHTAGLPIWLLQPSTVWDTPVKCNILEIVTPLNPANFLCISQHYLPFPTIFYGSATDISKHAAICTHSWKWLTFKEPFEGFSKG